MASASANLPDLGRALASVRALARRAPGGPLVPVAALALPHRLPRRASSQDVTDHHPDEQHPRDEDDVLRRHVPTTMAGRPACRLAPSPRWASGLRRRDATTP